VFVILSAITEVNKESILPSSSSTAAYSTIKVYASGGIVLNRFQSKFGIQMESLHNGHIPSQKIAVRAPIIKAASALGIALVSSGIK
jgi:hypothetical protein